MNGCRQNESSNSWWKHHNNPQVVHTTPAHQLMSCEVKSCMFIRNKSIIKMFLNFKPLSIILLSPDLWICSNEETNSSISWMAWGWVNIQQICIFGCIFKGSLVRNYIIVEMRLRKCENTMQYKTDTVNRSNLLLLHGFSSILQIILLSRIIDSGWSIAASCSPIFLYNDH